MTSGTGGHDTSEQSSRLGRIISRLFFVYARTTRGMTLGVRGIALDADGRVFLVRHSYVPGWHLPGGGVDGGETFEAALLRELREEGNLTARTEPRLLGLYLNTKASARDHVAVYVIDHAVQESPRLPDREIVESGFFPRDQLPHGTTQATRRRLSEALDGAARALVW